MRRFSLDGKLALLLALAAVAGIGALALFQRLLDAPLLAALAAIALVVPVAALAGRALMRPVSELFRTLSGAVVSFRDGDFSFSIHGGRRDELGELVAAHNELGRVLREERQDLFQRELLLHTMVQNTPNALLLVDARDRIVYANTAARQLFNQGRRLEGLAFAEVLAGTPPALRDVAADGRDAIFSVLIEHEEESFHASSRAFQLNGQPHRLYLFRRITRELGRQEAATWKKVIRVISHELNNSLAPITSLAHSGRELADRGDRERLARVFDTIEERARHLEGFVRGYAAFAKLPAPRPQALHWAPFLDGLQAHYAFRLAAPPPAQPPSADPAQLAQALINLLKNAHEAGGPAEAVEVEVRALGAEQRVDVRDRGSGMSEAVMTQAMVPFYSTKRSGTGLGLALAREIAEAHGGRLTLRNRDGGGLEASLWLPLRRAEEPAGGSGEVPAPTRG